MKSGTTPNNSRWGVAQSLLPNKWVYEHEEFNNVSAKNLPASDITTTYETSGYNNGDVGSSLQEVKYASVTNSKRIKTLIEAVAKVGIVALAAITLYATIQTGVPKIGLVHVEPIGGLTLEYSFESSSVKYAATMSVFVEQEGTKNLLETKDLDSTNKTKFEGTYTGTEGKFRFTITYDGAFGVGTLYSLEGVLI